jgi:hypothetical protein
MVGEQMYIGGHPNKQQGNIRPTCISPVQAQQFHHQHVQSTQSRVCFGLGRHRELAERENAACKQAAVILADFPSMKTHAARQVGHAWCYGEAHYVVMLNCQGHLMDKSRVAHICSKYREC